MLYWLFTDGQELIRSSIWGIIPITILTWYGIGWWAGTSGRRGITTGLLGGKEVQGILIATLFTFLSLAHIGVLASGEFFVRRGLSTGQGINGILIGPAGWDGARLGLGAAMLGVLFVISLILTWFLLRDGGAVREHVNYIRDPMRVRGDSGSAHFCRWREFGRFRKPDKQGMTLLGAFWGAKPGKGDSRKYMRLDMGLGRMNLSGEDIARGIMTIGAPGSGKSQSIILPAIADHMENEHSVIVVDPQGELTPKVMRFAAVTGHEVIVHDPTSKIYPRFNLGDGIGTISDARSIADVLVPPGNGDNKFWTDSASMLLSACLLRFESLGDIYEALSDVDFVGKRLEEKEDDAYRLANSFIASLAADGRLASNVVATLSTSLTGWADNTAREATSESDFKAEALTQQPAAVVLACPGRMRSVYAPYLGGVLRKLMLDLDTIGEQNRGPLPIPVGVILDEFPTLGKLDSLVQDVNLVRKRRISILIAAQTKGQFHMIYGNDATNALFAGMATQIIFGGCDQETAEFYSKASGQTTVGGEDEKGFSFGLPSGLSDDKPGSSGSSMPRQRQLLTADEIQTPGRGNAIIFSRYVTESYATQVIVFAKLTRMYQREDWNKRMAGLTEDDALIMKRPMSFEMPQSMKEAQEAAAEAAKPAAKIGGG